MPDRTAVSRAVEAVWRIESARLVGGLVRRFHDLDLAEELAQEALLAAMTQWPATGLPENPAAWLTTTAHRRGIDRLRRNRQARIVEAEISRDGENRPSARPLPDSDDRLDGVAEDDVLRLMFMTCHPALSSDARTALTLRLVCGLTALEIARSYLTSEATIAQRIVRAKRTLAQLEVPFELPRGAELPPRLGSILEVIYLLFNEGYAATTGEDWMRPALCEEALRLGRMTAEMMPQQAEPLGLVALMEMQASRLAARVDAAGRPILLMEQDRNRWDQGSIQRGLSALARAEAVAHERGPYVLQALIAACHARAHTPESTDWGAIVKRYDELIRVTPSPVIELNRAVAVSMAEGPQAGLNALEPLLADPRLKNYHLLPAARGDFLSRMGRSPEAAQEFHRAAQMTGNPRERELLLRRAGDHGAPAH